MKEYELEGKEIYVNLILFKDSRVLALGTFIYDINVEDAGRENLVVCLGDIGYQSLMGNSLFRDYPKRGLDNQGFGFFSDSFFMNPDFMEMIEFSLHTHLMLNLFFPNNLFTPNENERSVKKALVKVTEKLTQDGFKNIGFCTFSNKIYSILEEVNSL